MPRPPAQPDPRSDEQLVGAINSGDPGAFEALYQRHKLFVARVASRFTNDADEAQDAVQEVFISFMRKFPGFELRSKLTTYLYPAAKHTALSMRGRRLRMRLGADTMREPVADEPPVNHALRLSDPLEQALAALGDDHREVVLLRLVEQMSVDEVAAALEIPPGTVKSRLFNALRRLRDDPALKGLIGADAPAQPPPPATPPAPPPAPPADSG